jgi:hypothetical protein
MTGYQQAETRGSASTSSVSVDDLLQCICSISVTVGRKIILYPMYPINKTKGRSHIAGKLSGGLAAVLSYVRLCLIFAHCISIEAI